MDLLLLFQLSLLLSASITASAYETMSHYPPAEAPHLHPHHLHHSPTSPPTHPPIPSQAHQPVKPPLHTPAASPVYPPQRMLVAVEGVVYCKSCKYYGVDTLVGASPLAGSVVKLQCNNTKYPLVEHTKTDKNGYFFFMPQKLTTAAYHKCKVVLVSSPMATCSVPTNLHGGAAGATLIPAPIPPVEAPTKALPFSLFTVGPFAFEAPKKLPCHI